MYQEFGGRLGILMPELHHGALDDNPAAWIDKPMLFLINYLPLGMLSWLLLQFVKVAGNTGRRYLLVMEDFEDARSPSQATGGSIEDALVALDVLAQFHANNWMSSAAIERVPMLWSLGRGARVWQAMYLGGREAFVEQFGEVIGPDNVAVIDDIQDGLLEIMDRMVSPPWTVLHGDYRLDNILFMPNGELVVLDYQLCGHGRAGWDVAYFITTALEPKHRTEEERMLQHYHDALIAAGVSDYSFEMLTSDCADAKSILAHRMACGTGQLDTQVAGQDEDFMEILVKRVVGWLQ